MKPKRMMFSAEMALAIEERRKGVTRRVVKSKFADVNESRWHCEGINGHDDYPNHAEFKRFAEAGETFISQSIYIDCPCQVGEMVAVCEPWRVSLEYDKPSGSAHIPDDVLICFGVDDNGLRGRQRLARFMPMRFVRNFLRVTAVRVERMQDITEEQAVCEGVQELMQSRAQRIENGGAVYRNYLEARQLFNDGLGPILSFASLIDHIHGEGAWASNPWVWVIEFEVLEGGIK